MAGDFLSLYVHAQRILAPELELLARLLQFFRNLFGVLLREYIFKIGVVLLPRFFFRATKTLGGLTAHKLVLF